MFCAWQNENGSVLALTGETELETSGETSVTPANDDLALQTALYGLVIQSCVDKVCHIVLYHTCCPFVYWWRSVDLC